MSFTDQLPLIMLGDRQVPNMALRTLSTPSLDARQSRIISSMYRDTALKSQVDQGFVVRDEVLRDLNAEMSSASRNAISAKGFELEAQRIATLMKDRYNIGLSMWVAGTRTWPRVEPPAIWQVDSTSSGAAWRPSPAK